MTYENDFETCDLDDYQTEYTTSEAQNSDGPVPDGKYQVNIDLAHLTRSKTSDRPMIKWTLRILGPSHRNRFLWKYSVFGKPAMGYIKGDLEMAGLTLEKLNDLNHRIGELKNVKMEITKRTKDDYESIFFNKRLELGETYENDEEVPF